MGHGHAHHHHAHNEARTLIAAGLTGSFMLAEVVGGVLFGSLALLADAGHMLTDFVSLSLAFFAFRLSRRPADWKRTYGYDRFQVLAAFVNGVALLVIVAWIVVEAIRRFAEPVEVAGLGLMAVAGLGLMVNIAAFLALHGADRDNLNIRGATLHVLGDLLGSVAALIAGLVIWMTGWTPIDPLLSLLVAVLILRSAWGLTKDSARILLEAAPKDLDVRHIAPDLMEAIPEVEDVHHVHAWSITEGKAMITLHARVPVGSMPDPIAAAIKARLAERFHITHATVEIECEGCADS
ncbi:MAG: cation transporter [Euryhalocaulis sp.]|uniref:cation diffusion facilitator family transporter n=1 Tax=Euryhalocaulis sp. TaxID=2744307 RepID=UPI00184E57C2|nr:cation diffusion facilitator family transporter [Euryhalocaulis sp.]MBA4802531.1 cation transporter [Euryhalocaulis sp.]